MILMINDGSFDDIVSYDNFVANAKQRKKSPSVSHAQTIKHTHTHIQTHESTEAFNEFSSIFQACKFIIVLLYKYVARIHIYV